MASMTWESCQFFVYGMGFGLLRLERQNCQPLLNLASYPLYDNWYALKQIKISYDLLFMDRGSFTSCPIGTASRARITEHPVYCFLFLFNQVSISILFFFLFLWVTENPFELWLSRYKLFSHNIFLPIFHLFFNLSIYLSIISLLGLNVCMSIYLSLLGLYVCMSIYLSLL